jgi:5-oxoprolinase (ATP-hydrolysing)
MTNTRITDAEVFERRYPVILREFSLREGSGGKGKYKGGDGVVRDIEFRIPVQVSILSERRVYHPYGMEGGEDAQCGLNIWVRNVETSNPKRSDRLLNGDDQRESSEHHNGSKESAKSTEPKDKSNGTHPAYEERRINLGGKNTASMSAGERIIIHTPGGGGWGIPDSTPTPNGKVRENDPKYSWKGGSFASREEMALQS